MTILVTGGAGFIGSNFILNWFEDEELAKERIVNLDKLTYAGNLGNLSSLEGNPHHIFIKGCIGDQVLVQNIFSEWNPRAVINFAAESHVDRSIVGPHEFIQTNVVDFSKLLHEAYIYWSKQKFGLKSQFRFLHISTDEVYGSLSLCDEPFTETSPYRPNSPYSASKASSDHIARAYFKTYGMPVQITNCSNNYGAYQYPEKLIPLVIYNALHGDELPIYGDGKQVRDWLYVDDHCSAIRKVLHNGEPGEVYNIGGYNQKQNIEVVELICSILDEIHPRQNNVSYKEQIKYVDDRKGHDRRYAINASKINDKLGWRPEYEFDDGIRKTVIWYVENLDWVEEAFQTKI